MHLGAGAAQNGGPTAMPALGVRGTEQQIAIGAGVGVTPAWPRNQAPPEHLTLLM